MKTALFINLSFLKGHLSNTIFRLFFIFSIFSDFPNYGVDEDDKSGEGGEERKGAKEARPEHLIFSLDIFAREKKLDIFPWYFLPAEKFDISPLTRNT